MSATNYFEQAILQLIFQAEPIAALADNAGTSPSVNLYVSLHTGDPGEAGDQTTNETAYTSYARVPVARTNAGWTIATNEISNTGTVTFPTCTGGNSTITHWGLGLSDTAAGTLLFKGALDASLAVSNGITPEFKNGNLKVSAD